MKSFEKLFGARVPIIQAPMAGIQDSNLAIAVSNAGGIGSLPCGMLSLEKLEYELKAIKSKTGNPFNVNFFCHSEPINDQQTEDSWWSTLSPYYKEYGLILKNNKPCSSEQRKPFTSEMANLLEKYRPSIVSFHFGLPSDDLISHTKSWGAKILSSATTVEEAIWLEQHGVDAIIAQGLEAGGHRGHFLSDGLTKQMKTFALLPKILNAVNCPIIAAGGISHKNTIKKALQLGATGVQLGTAYLLCPEVQTKDFHRAAINAINKPTAITNLFSGRPARGVTNRLMQELGPINAKAPPFPLASDFIAPLRQLAEKQGYDDFSPLWCGENREGCLEISAAKLTEILSDGLY